MIRCGGSSTTFYRQRWQRLMDLRLGCASTAIVSSSNVGHCRLYSSSGVRSNRQGPNKNRPDPFARRPNKKCDPYGQGGKPLTIEEVKKLQLTIDSEWKLECNLQNRTNQLGSAEVDLQDENNKVNNNNPPIAITREFWHADFLSGSSFLRSVAAVAELSAHYPSITLERRLDSRQKKWNVVSTVRCHTKVLEGLSHHDFYLAMLIDVESQRPNVAVHLLKQD